MSDGKATSPARLGPPENVQCLSAREHCIVVQKPMRVLTRDEAIAFAAWLVMLADLLPGDGSSSFVEFVEALQLIRQK